MDATQKNKIAQREIIRSKIRQGMKSSQIVAEGFESEMVRDVKAEENNLRDKNARQEEKDLQKRSQEAKRDRQYRQMMIDLGQDPDKIVENDQGAQTTVGAPAAEIKTGSKLQTRKYGK